MRNAVSQYGMIALRIPETKSANLVQPIEEVLRKGVGKRQVLIKSI